MIFYLFLTLLIGAGPFAVVGALAALAVAAGMPRAPRCRSVYAPRLRLAVV